MGHTSSRHHNNLEKYVSPTPNWEDNRSPVGMFALQMVTWLFPLEANLLLVCIVLFLACLILAVDSVCLFGLSQKLGSKNVKTNYMK